MSALYVRHQSRIFYRSCDIKFMLKELIPYTFETASPESMGIPSGAVRSFIERIENEGLCMQGFMLYRHGKVISRAVAEPYKVTDKRHVYSISKSYTGTAIGIARDEGIISLNERLIDIFPEYTPQNPCSNLCKMTVHHLLSMNTGHDIDTTASLLDPANGTNWIKTFMNLNVEHEPGSKFVYNSGASYMLSAIITKKTGMSLLEYLTPRLFNPLGIKGVHWDTCPRGMNLGGWGCHVSVRDMLKLGVLYLKCGMWNKMRIVSEEWVKLASTAHSDNSAVGGTKDWQQGYCYQMWRCQHNCYRGDGAYGQLIIISEEKDMVISIISDDNRFQPLCDAFWDTIFASAGDTALDENPEALAELGKSCETVHVNEKLSAKFIKDYSGNFELYKNIANAVSMNIKTDANRAQIRVTCDDGNTYNLEAGNGEWYYNQFDKFPAVISEMMVVPSNSCRDAYAAASFAWEDENTLCVNVQFTDSPHGFNYIVYIGENPHVVSRRVLYPHETHDIKIKMLS